MHLWPLYDASEETPRRTTGDPRSGHDLSGATPSRSPVFKGFDDYFRFTTGRPGWSATGRFQPRRNAMRRMTTQSIAPLIVVAVGGQ